MQTIFHNAWFEAVAKIEAKNKYLLTLLRQINGIKFRLSPRRGAHRRAITAAQIEEKIATFNSLSLPDFWITIDNEDNYLHVITLENFNISLHTWLIQECDICWRITASGERVLLKTCGKYNAYVNKEPNEENENDRRKDGRTFKEIFARIDT